MGRVLERAGGRCARARLERACADHDGEHAAHPSGQGGAGKAGKAGEAGEADGTGEPVVTDGPFAETKEQLGGLIVIECADLDAALAFATTVPCAPRGSIEVRAIAESG